jgi:hypothetical protein
MVSPASLLYLSSFSFHIRFGNVVKWLKEILSTIITYLTAPSPLKPLGQLKPNCPGMIIGRSYTNFPFFMPVGNPRWPPPQDID